MLWRPLAGAVTDGICGFSRDKDPSELNFKTFLDLLDIWDEEDLKVYMIANGIYAAMERGTSTPSGRF